MDKVKIVNLTPHKIVITNENCEPILEIPPSGLVARLRQERVRVGSIPLGENEIPVVKTKYGYVENLPPPKPGTYYIVSAVVAQALPDREDLLVPDTGPGSVCRDKDGRIVGVKHLMRF